MNKTIVLTPNVSKESLDIEKSEELAIDNIIITLEDTIRKMDEARATDWNFFASGNYVKTLLSAIKGYKAEIERLKSPKFFIENEVSEKELSEMLKKGRVGVIPHIKCSIRRIDEDGIRAEAIKEFWNRVKGKAYRNSYWQDVVLVADGDNIVNEMVGESNVETDITANI